jgi:hypothetical protein
MDSRALHLKRFFVEDVSCRVHRVYQLDSNSNRFRIETYFGFLSSIQSQWFAMFNFSFTFSSWLFSYILFHISIQRHFQLFLSSLLQPFIQYFGSLSYSNSFFIKISNCKSFSSISFDTDTNRIEGICPFFCHIIHNSSSCSKSVFIMLFRSSQLAQQSAAPLPIPPGTQGLANRLRPAPEDCSDGRSATHSSADRLVIGPFPNHLLTDRSLPAQPISCRLIGGRLPDHPRVMVMCSLHSVFFVRQNAPPGCKRFLLPVGGAARENRKVCVTYQNLRRLSKFVPNRKVRADYQCSS